MSYSSAVIIIGKAVYTYQVAQVNTTICAATQTSEGRELIA
jgi:hypothetical protein